MSSVGRQVYYAIRDQITKLVQARQPQEEANGAGVSDGSPSAVRKTRMPRMSVSVGSSSMNANLGGGGGGNGDGGDAMAAAARAVPERIDEGQEGGEGESEEDEEEDEFQPAAAEDESDPMSTLDEMTRATVETQLEDWAEANAAMRKCISDMGPLPELKALRAQCSAQEEELNTLLNTLPAGAREVYERQWQDMKTLQEQASN
eukprot:SAG11_NODE_171_length_13596_cov_15.767356_2_plen_204_part_00